MKKTFILVTAIIFSLMSFPTPVSAQEESGIVLDKKLQTTSVEDAYNLVLEAYVTGASNQTIIHLPTDLVLILDVSRSMHYAISSGTSDLIRMPSRGYSYFDVPYGSDYGKYYYKDGDNYYAVIPNSVGGKYYLYYTKNGKSYYLYGDSVVTERPTDVTDKHGVIWTGVLYSNTRMTALQNAVRSFIDVVAKDAKDHSIDNMISIVKFANHFDYNKKDPDSARKSLEEGNNLDNADANITEVVKNFRDVNDIGNIIELKDAVDGLIPYGATFADFGMEKAGYVLGDDNPMNIKSTEAKPRNKVVILFTDGSPTHNSSFESKVANQTVLNALELKKTRCAGLHGWRILRGGWQE